jgi:hypothetical protein
MTPQEAWSGYKPNIAYAQVPKAKRRKLDDRGESVFLLAIVRSQRHTSSITH